MTTRRRSSPAPPFAVSSLTTPFTVTIVTTCIHMLLPKKLMCQKCNVFIQSYVPNFCEDVAESWPSNEQMNRRASTKSMTCERPWDQVKYYAPKARKEQSRRCEQIYELLGQHQKTLIDATEIGTETRYHQPYGVPTVAQTNSNVAGRQGCDDLSSDLTYATTALALLANTTIDTSARAAADESPPRLCFGWYGSKYNRIFEQSIKSACRLQDIAMETTGVVEIPDQFPLHRVYNSIGGADELIFCKESNLGSYVLRSSECDGTTSGDKKNLCEKCVLLSRTTHDVIKKAKTLEKDANKGINFTEDRINAMMDANFTEDRINAMMDATPVQPYISTMVVVETVPGADEILPEVDDVVEIGPAVDETIPESIDHDESPRRRCFGWYGNKYNLIFQQALKSVSPLRGITMKTPGVVEIPDQFPLHRIYNSIGGAAELLFCKEPDLGSYVLRSRTCNGTAAGKTKKICNNCALLRQITHYVVKRAQKYEEDANEGINFSEDRINIMSDATTLKLMQRIRKARNSNAKHRNSNAYNIKRRILRGVEKASKKRKADDLKTQQYASALDIILPQIRK